MIGREPRIETKAIIAAVLAAAPYEHHHVRCYTYRELAEQVYGNGDALYEPTAAQLSAVRRAVARLVAEGRAERDGRAWTSEDPLFAPTHIRRLKKRDGWPEHLFRNPGGVLIRRPLTPAELEDAKARDRALGERLLAAFTPRSE